MLTRGREKDSRLKREDGIERLLTMAGWDQVKQRKKRKEKKRSLLKRRLDTGISYSRGKAGLNENNI